MPLKVRVISYKGRTPERRMEASFDQAGGTIGRSARRRGNHLSLPDPERFISRQHARIDFQDGRFILTDTSVDGTYLNQRSQRVGRETVALADGDRLWIGDYELTVDVLSNGTQDAPRDFFGFDETSTPAVDEDPAPRHSSARQADALFDQDWWSEEDVFDEPARAAPDSQAAGESPLHDAFSTPPVAEDRRPSGEIPSDFDFGELIEEVGRPPSKRSAGEAAHSPQPETPEDGFDLSFFEGLDEAPASSPDPPSDRHPSPARPSPASPSASAAGAGEVLDQQTRQDLARHFCQAAGIDASTLPTTIDLPLLLASLGAVYREMVAGLMAVLRGRSEIKTHLRVEATSIKPADNNPLKFFREVDEALKQLLTGDPPGFIEARDAVREGFADIMNHQMALHAGLQAALIDLIERFDPQRFAESYEEGGVFQKRAKAWDAYQEAYRRMANEALENIFGKPFADAYEAQIRKLTSQPKKQ